MAESEHPFPFIENNLHRDLLQAAGFHSVKDITRGSALEFEKKMVSLPADQAAQIYQSSRTLSDTLDQLTRAAQLSNDPIIRALPGFDSRATATQAREKARAILGDASPFESFTPLPENQHYADPAGIQSLFSPGRYLAVLYGQAKKLGADLDTRRPDLRTLTLNNTSMLTQLPALKILKDVLVLRGGNNEQTLYSTLKTTFYPQSLPYDDDQTKLQLALENRNLTLTQLWWQFDPDNILREDHLLSTMAQLKLTPEYHQHNRFLEKTFYKPGNVPALYGVNDINNLATLDKFARQVGISIDTAQEIGSTAFIQSLLSETEQKSKDTAWLKNVKCLAAADYFIRLSSRTRLSINDLDILFSLTSGQSDIVPLIAFVVCEYLRLNQKYGLTASEFSVLMGNANPPASKGEVPYYDQHFINPSTGEKLALGDSIKISFNLGSADAIREQLSQILGITEEECAAIYSAHIHPGKENDTKIALTSSVLSRFCFYVRGPALLGISRTTAGKLCQLRSTNATLDKPQNTLHTLLAFRAMEDSLAWAVSEQCPPDQILVMLASDSGNGDATFIAQMQARIATREKEQQTLSQFLSSVFRLSPDVMAALLKWPQKSGTAPIEVSGTPELTDNQIFHLSQLVLIARWGQLNAEDIQLLSDPVLAGTDFSGPPTFALLQTIARLNHWKQRIKVPVSQALAYLLGQAGKPIDVDTIVAFEGAEKGNINAVLEGLKKTQPIPPEGTPPRKNPGVTLMTMLWLSDRLALAGQLGISNNTLENLYLLLQFTHKEDKVADPALLKTVADAFFTEKSRNLPGERK
ncbi:Tc toxin subunit A [Cedecea sp. NFIX57]|uniref:Tc toxin subunit A n=1 Tax=Cedecea sp. NFIX57 TaxID=1566286 RepID=UPI000A0BBBC4|nr:Tc toxin subunit A [Cedecea sp. NFIX57]SMG61704.1 virulence plasmid A protein [Cedecea sp. NFIX57]